MRPRPLHIAGVVIIGAWLASLGWLIRREYFQGRTPGEVSAAARVSPGTVFFAAYLDGRQVGVASTTIDTLPTAVRVSERLDVLLPDAGGERRMRFATDAMLSHSLSLRSFSSVVAGDAPGLALDGTVEAGDSLMLRLSRPGSPPLEQRRPLGRALPRSVIPLRFALDATPVPGRVMDVPLLDPLSGAIRPARFVVGAARTIAVPDSATLDSATGRWVPAHLDTVMAWPLDEIGQATGVRAWVDARGFVVRARTPFGLTIERTAFEIAHLNYRAGHPGTLAAEPSSRRAAEPLDSMVVAADTAATLLIPVHAPRIDSTARRLTDGLGDRAAAARAVFDFVARRIAPASDDSVPGALRALTTRRGSVASRALLFVALSRAAGIPARTVYGSREQNGHARPHVWAEIHLDQWMPVDPALSQWPADMLRRRVGIDGAGHPIETLAFPLQPSRATGNPSD